MKNQKKYAVACVWDNKKWLVSIPTMQMVSLESLGPTQHPTNLLHAFTMRKLS